MKITAIVTGLIITLVFVGILVLHFFVSKWGHDEHYFKDKVMELNYQSAQALEHDRADLALKYQAKALKALEKENQPELKAYWLLQRGRAHLMLKDNKAAEADLTVAAALQPQEPLQKHLLHLLRAELLSEPTQAEVKTLLQGISAEQVQKWDKVWQRDFYAVQAKAALHDKACDEAKAFIRKACVLGDVEACNLHCP